MALEQFRHLSADIQTHVDTARSALLVIGVGSAMLVEHVYKSVAAKYRDRKIDQAAIEKDCRFKN